MLYNCYSRKYHFVSGLYTISLGVQYHFIKCVLPFCQVFFFCFVFFVFFGLGIFVSLFYCCCFFVFFCLFVCLMGFIGGVHLNWLPLHYNLSKVKGFLWVVFINILHHPNECHCNIYCSITPHIHTPKE